MAVWIAPRSRELLGRGLSLERIGWRFGHHESTIAHWVERYRLRAANHGKHATRSGLERRELEALVDRGMTIAEIAGAVGRSKSTVRYWLTRHGLKTRGRRGRRAESK
jgi:transposase